MPASAITTLLDLPELRLIPGERMSSWGPALDDHVIDFACRTGMLTTDAARRYYETQRIGTMCAYVIPGATTARGYETYGELMLWFFIYDDWAEQLGHHLSPRQVAGVVDIVETWFAEDARDVRGLEVPAAQSLRGVWAKLQQDTSPDWRRRLRTEVDGYIRTAVEEAGLVRTGRVNPFGAASELRPTATAARPVFTLAEHAYGIEIPAETARHPFLVRAARAAAMGIAFGNDIIGLKSDLLRGIRDNLVLSLQEEHGGDLQENVRRAAGYFQRAAGEFSALRSQFQAGSINVDAGIDAAIRGRDDVAVFLQILEDWLYEGVKWQLRDTDRYSTTVRLTERENPNQLLALAAF